MTGSSRARRAIQVFIILLAAVGVVEVVRDSITRHNWWELLVVPLLVLLPRVAAKVHDLISPST